jgi:DNA-binding MarR family transcriptional regulator
MTEESREPQRHTGFLLRRAQQKHMATWQSVISGDTTSVQYGVLAVLDRRPALAQKEICDELDLDRSTVADICSRMEKNGLLSRIQDRQDRRRNVLDLTPAGRAELARLKPLVEEVQARLTRTLFATDLEQLRALLARLIGD